MGKESVAIDISPLSVEVMQARGLDARLVNLFDTHFVERFDTILMLMNGSGIIGRVENFGDFFQRMKLFAERFDTILMLMNGSGIIGRVENFGDFFQRMKLLLNPGGCILMDSSDLRYLFDWLYVDFNTLSLYASQYGFKAELVKEGSHYDYLAKLTL